MELDLETVVGLLVCWLIQLEVATAVSPEFEMRAWKIDATICGSCREANCGESDQDFVHQRIKYIDLYAVFASYSVLLFFYQASSWDFYASYWVLGPGSFPRHGLGDDSTCTYCETVSVTRRYDQT